MYSTMVYENARCQRTVFQIHSWTYYQHVLHAHRFTYSLIVKLVVFRRYVGYFSVFVYSSHQEIGQDVHIYIIRR
jgi:hypothetical protein